MKIHSLIQQPQDRLIVKNLMTLLSTFLQLNGKKIVIRLNYLRRQFAYSLDSPVLKGANKSSSFEDHGNGRNRNLFK